MLEGAAIPEVLGLRSGDLVEVRSEREILSTLDATGRLDGLPVMPEMLQYCGKQVRVYRRAEKTCDTIGPYASRRMTNTVHLEGLRCDGGGHGGCQAACLMFWKEAWLKQVDAPASASTPRLTRAQLDGLATRPDPEAAGEPIYMCQATELPRASTLMDWWYPGQYLRELRTRNVPMWSFVRALVISWYNAVLRRMGGPRYPYVEGTLTKTPTGRLDLRAGERVRVKSRKEILATLNTQRRNRGLLFDVEMVPYCGREFRVLQRVTHIINERTGKMMQLPGDCLILEGVFCQGFLSRKRLFCPRSIYPFWRELWLERVE
jgi:hypothetical protein